MKTFLTLIVMTLVQLASPAAKAYILPLDFILQKSAGLAGSSIISIEQDVQFKDGVKTYTVKETWLIEGDRNLKLQARGVGELKDAININYLYNNKNKTSLLQKNKSVKLAPADFFEKFLAIKSKDSYLAYMKELKIGDNVRLSRAAGQVCFAVGNISTETDVQPHFWFDQSSFRLSKMRFPSQSEIEFSDYVEKDKVHYPRLKTISWQGKTVTIKVTKITTKTSSTIQDFYPESLQSSAPLALTNFGLAGSVLDEFYARFR